MTQPTDLQINTRIAEYMGTREIQMYPVSEFCPDYTESFDALIPVVEKLGLDDSVFSYNKRKGNWLVAIVNHSTNFQINHVDKSPARALSLAIYEVIGNE